jgi:CHAT domain-containing protein
LYAERARARTLVEAISPTGETATVDPNAGRTQLPPSVTLLYYVALDDRLLIWVMDRAHTHDIAVSVRQAELEHLVQQYRSEMLLSSIAARDTPSLSRLYDLLIRPVADRIPEGSELVIVPDGVLHAVPFAALIRRDDRRFLIEEHAIKITPSVTLLLAQSPKTQHSAPTRTALVIGNPRLEGADAEVAPNLPEAETEAKQIATLYSGSTLLIGADATRQAFLSTAGQYEVIHFAGHAVANDAHPDLSRLLFAGDGEASGSLFARDIAQQPFAATRLVVLGACRTSAGRIRRGEGVFSLARPFLAAGVPAVVASLWDVNDRASRRLLVAFHSQLRQSANPTEALRKAQLELMADADPLLQSPAAWAGFTLIGSD